MKHQYRLVKVTKSDGPNHEQHDTSKLGTRHQGREVWMREPSRHHPVLWILGIFIVAFIVVAVIWMYSVSGSLAHTNQVVTSNSNALGRVSNQLSGIQAKLSAIGQQLNQLQSEIRNFFTTAMNYLHQH